MVRKAEETRAFILKSAARVIQCDGLSALTLDKVAQEAGISKGGLLYHFKSKQALVTGLFTTMLDTFEQSIEQAWVQEDQKPGSWLRAYIKASFETHQEEVGLHSAFIAALGNFPELLEIINEHSRRWWERACQDEIPIPQAKIVMMAADGFWLSQIFKLTTIDLNTDQATLDALFALTKP